MAWDFGFFVVVVVVFFLHEAAAIFVLLSNQALCPVPALQTSTQFPALFRSEEC